MAADRRLEIVRAGRRVDECWLWLIPCPFRLVLLLLFAPRLMVDSFVLGPSTIAGAGVTMDALLTFRCRVGAGARLLMLGPAVVLIVGARLSF